METVIPDTRTVHSDEEPLLLTKSMAQNNQLVPDGVYNLVTLLDLVRFGQARTRPELARLSGLGRAVVTDKLKQLLDLGLVVEGDLAPSAGGRAPRSVAFGAEAGRLLVAELGATSLACGVTNLAGTCLSNTRNPLMSVRGLKGLWTGWRRCSTSSSPRAALPKRGSGASAWACRDRSSSLPAGLSGPPSCPVGTPTLSVTTWKGGARQPGRHGRAPQPERSEVTIKRGAGARAHRVIKVTHASVGPGRPSPSNVMKWSERKEAVEPARLGDKSQLKLLLVRGPLLGFQEDPYFHCTKLPPGGPRRTAAG